MMYKGAEKQNEKNPYILKQYIHPAQQKAIAEYMNSYKILNK